MNAPSYSETLEFEIDRSYEINLDKGKADFPRFATISPVIERYGGEIRTLRASCVCALEQFTRMHRTTALQYTVEPGRPIVGVEASETVEAVLSQRLLTAARP